MENQNPRSLEGRLSIQLFSRPQKMEKYSPGYFQTFPRFSQVFLKVSMNNQEDA